MVLRGNLLKDGIISGLYVGDDDLAVDRRELPDGVAAGTYDLEDRAVQGLQGAGFPLDDA